MILYALFIFIVFIILTTNIQMYENFCPDKLTYNNNAYYLWNNNNIWQKFLTYYDYLNFYHFMQSNYNTKNIYCKPLYPINKVKNDYNTMSKVWTPNRNFRYNLRI